MVEPCPLFNRKHYKSRKEGRKEGISRKEEGRDIKVIVKGGTDVLPKQRRSEREKMRKQGERVAGETRWTLTFPEYQEVRVRLQIRRGTCPEVVAYGKGSGRKSCFRGGCDGQSIPVYVCIYTFNERFRCDDMSCLIYGSRPCVVHVARVTKCGRRCVCALGIINVRLLFALSRMKKKINN
jgi:hypothetical protein